MDYKQKYEEALERARKINSGEGVAAPSDYTICETIFPELKESDDERIRKEIIQSIQDNMCIIHKDKCIAWLEKQGEQKFPSLSEKEIVCLKRILDFLREEHNSYTGKDFTNEIAVLEWLIIHPVLVHSSELQQNQGEQKPAWSKENICYYDDICEILINLINSPKSNVNKDVVQKDLDWLRSVKESQLKPAWSEEDENGFGDALWAIQQARTIAKNENEMGGLWYAEKWLKSLKERMKGEKL